MVLYISIVKFLERRQEDKRLVIKKTACYKVFCTSAHENLTFFLYHAVISVLTITRYGS